MASEPQWLAASEIVALNQYLLDYTGEPHQLVNPGELESAQAKPINHWHFGEHDVVVLGVVLCLGIARNHPFLQGNKRTAFAAMDQFLYQNGWDLTLPDEIAVAEALVDVLVDNMSEHRFMAIVQQHTVPIC